MDKRSLSERDICTKFINPALRQAGWGDIRQIREEVERVDELAAVCDRLETGLSRADAIRSYVIESVVQHAVKPSDGDPRHDLTS